MPAPEMKSAWRSAANIAEMPFEWAGLMMQGMWRLKPMSKNRLYAGYQHYCEISKLFNPRDTRARLYDHTEAFLENRKKSRDDEIKPYDIVRLLKQALSDDYKQRLKELFVTLAYEKANARSYMAQPKKAKDPLDIAKFIQNELEEGRLQKSVSRRNCLHRFHRDRKKALARAAQITRPQPALHEPV